MSQLSGVFTGIQQAEARMLLEMPQNIGGLGAPEPGGVQTQCTLFGRGGAGERENKVCLKFQAQIL